MLSVSEINGINRILGMRPQDAVWIRSERDLTQLARTGIPKRQCNVFLSHAGLSVSQFSRLSKVSRNAISTRSEDQLMSPVATERLLEIAMLFVRGTEILGSLENFQAWMHTESAPLGGIMPAELLDTSLGIQELNAELTRIDEGIFA